MKNILLYALLLLGLPCMAQNPVKIIQRSQDAVKVKSFEAISTLTIMDKHGNQRIRSNTMASKTFPDGTEKRIIKFTAPEEVRGTGILIFDYKEKTDDMWIYLPALRKTRRIVSKEKSRSFMGSEFSNSDMSAPTVSDFTYINKSKETYLGDNCWRIEVRPISDKLTEEYGYALAVRWIGVEDYVLRKTEYFNAAGELLKVIETINFKQLDLQDSKYMITEMIARNQTNGRSSKMKIDKFTTGSTNDDYFTISYLER